MNLDEQIVVNINIDDIATIREIFAAARDEMLVCFDGLPTKEEVKEWLENDASISEIVTDIFFSINGDILDSNVLNIVEKNFDDFYSYVVDTYEW